jgi:hypothetical protein
MKQYLLFAGRDDGSSKGVHGLIGSFDSCAEAFVALVDRQIPCGWWHILDTRTGEVVERRHLKIHNGMIGFQRSDWVVAPPVRQEVVATPPALPISVPTPAVADLGGIEAGLRSVVTTGIKNGKTHTLANGSADH